MALSKHQINQFLTTYFNYFAGLVIIILVIVFWQFLLRPQYNRLQTSGILQYRNTIAAVEQRQQHLQRLELMAQAYAEFDDRTLRHLTTTLPSDYTEAEAFAEVERLFSGSALVVQSVNISTINQSASADSADATAQSATATPTEAAVQEVILTVNLTTPDQGKASTTGETATLSYADFKNVLSRIERQQHLMNLEQLVYTPDSRAFTLILRTYQRTSHVPGL